MPLPVRRLLGIMTITIPIEKKNAFESVCFADRHFQRHLNKKLMIIISNYTLIEKSNLIIFVKNAEEITCPCCDAKLEVIGSRPRKYISSDGNRHTLVIRRLRCTTCRKIHHELPDILVPYKRYDSQSIESTLTSEGNLTVAAEKSTIKRWMSWFHSLKDYMLRIIIATRLRFDYEAVEKELYHIPSTVLHGIWYFVGSELKWLSRTVRILANTNSYLHTRSAFMSKT